jgi:hypothetical protein
MPNNTDQDKSAVKYMSGIANQIKNSTINTVEINKLFVFLNENDRRRNSNWKTLFPWLVEFEQRVV